MVWTKICLPFARQDIPSLGTELKSFKPLIFKDKPHRAALNLRGGDHLPAVTIQGQMRQIVCRTPEAVNYPAFWNPAERMLIERETETHKYLPCTDNMCL